MSSLIRSDVLSDVKFDSVGRVLGCAWLPNAIRSDVLSDVKCDSVGRVLGSMFPWLPLSLSDVKFDSVGRVKRCQV